jgi:hypothetical protein
MQAELAVLARCKIGDAAESRAMRSTASASTDFGRSRPWSARCLELNLPLIIFSALILHLAFLRIELTVHALHITLYRRRRSPELHNFHCDHFDLSFDVHVQEVNLGTTHRHVHGSQKEHAILRTACP